MLSGNGSNLIGGMTLNGGVLQLNYSSNTTTKLRGGGLTSAGGTLQFAPHATIFVNQTFGATAFTAGHTELARFVTGTFLTVTLNGISRSGAATVNFDSSLNYTTTTGNTNGLLGTGRAPSTRFASTTAT